MAIDISLSKRVKSKEDIQKDLSEKFIKDTAKPTKWKPVYSRIFIKPDPETLSSVIEVKSGDSYIRGVIVAVGPDCGWRDGKQIHVYKPGMRVIYNKTHELRYKSADGSEIVFLRDNSDQASILAIEDEDDEGEEVLKGFEGLERSNFLPDTVFEFGPASKKNELHCRECNVDFAESVKDHIYRFHSNKLLSKKAGVKNNE